MYMYQVLTNLKQLFVEQHYKLSVLPRLRFCDICRVWICVGTNPKQMCSDLPW